MSDIRIQREHSLGLAPARSLAQAWSSKIESKFGMSCRYAEGDTEDCLHFERAGVSGSMRIAATQFDIQAELGFLFSAFKDKVEGEIADQLDRLLAQAAKDSATV